jgi:hypothetical protein
VVLAEAAEGTGVLMLNEQENDLPKQVQLWLRDNEELRRLFDKLETDQREKLKGLLSDAASNYDEYGVCANATDVEEYNKTCRTLAQRYVNTSCWHTPWLTTYFLKEVLQAQMKGLMWQCNLGVYPEYSIRHNLSEPYRTFVPPIILVISIVLVFGGVGWLFYKEYFVVSIVLAILFSYYFFIEKPLAWWRRHKRRKKLYELIELITFPVFELDNKSYDAEVMIRRLQSYEEKGLYIASIAFSLLKMQTRQQSLHDES